MKRTPFPPSQVFATVQRSLRHPSALYPRVPASQDQRLDAETGTELPAAVPIQLI